MHMGRVWRVGKEVQWAFKGKDKARKGCRQAPVLDSGCRVWTLELSGPWGSKPKTLRCSCGKELHEICLLQTHIRGCCRADLTHMVVVTFNQLNTSLSEPHSFRAVALQSMCGMHPGSGPMQNLFDVALWLLLHSCWC